MPHTDAPLRRWLPERPAEAALLAPGLAVPLHEMRAATALGGVAERLAGRSVLIGARRQLAAALAMIELDGVAGRIVIAPPDLAASDLAAVVAEAAVGAAVTDEPERFAGSGLDVAAVGPPRPAGRRAPPAPGTGRDTEWVLLTSGTTGTPKMVVHSRAALTGAIAAATAANTAAGPEARRVWGTFYDIRRYGGLQILLRALTGAATLVLSEAGEPVADHLRRLAAAGVTHLSGTPSHWRRAVLHPEAALLDPRYVRLSGEVADQAILDRLAQAYPRAAIGHAYASTEAGVGFEVDDGREGFPASLLDPSRPVAMKVVDGSLRIRSPRTASGYVGGGGALADADGFIDTDDMVERRGDRLYFAGRRSGVINVGGLKVHPEEVEAVINRHPGARMSLVRSRQNPITGAVVVADVVPAEGAPAADPQRRALRAEILQLCRGALPGHKVPVLLRFVEALAVTPAGKLSRAHA